MTRKQRRAVVIVVGLALITVAVWLVLRASENSITFFKSPTDVAKEMPRPEMRFRLGGLVKAGSLRKEPNAVYEFTVTDNAASLPVTYRGIVPDLFREGQGVIAEGRLGSDGVFVADYILAKHDEKYTPPQVASALKKNSPEQGRQQKAPGT